MNLLFVVPYTPTLIRTRPYNLLLGLVRRGHAVTLATLWETPDEQAALQALGQAGLRVWARRLTRVQAAQNAVGAIARQHPLQAWYCWQPSLAQWLAQALRQQPNEFDAIHVEHLRGAEYGRHLQQVLRDLGRTTPVIWDSVDCISLLFEQAMRQSRSLFGRWMSRLELPRTRRYEGDLVRTFTGVLVTSPIDQAALTALARAQGGADPARKVRLLPNGVDGRYFAPPDQPGARAGSPEQVILTGKMSYHANVTAALQLVNDIMPLVWQQRPEVQVVLAGSAPPPAVRALGERADGRVRVTGYVDDLRPYLRGATVAVAPVTYGAGIQNKVLEAMACGVPVVASSQASSALQVTPGHELLVAASPPAFAEAILGLLASETRCSELAQAGRRYVVSHHDWEAIAARLEGYYDKSAWL